MPVRDGLSTQEANKALARYWFDEGWTRCNVEVADRVFHPDFLLNGKRVGPEGPKQSVLRRHAAFSELTVDVGVQVAEGPWVATWYTTRATHVGEYAGVAPTGRSIFSEGVQVWRVEDGLAVEDRNVFDLWKLVSQLREKDGQGAS
ncbi:ester cyclase [Streptomyces sp. NPDC004647]|uniref:ester cyclase n=1 Tax=Streptomyces sp. NPDC004647 TaxID=3154671 RepID=UPI0033B43CD7